MSTSLKEILTRLAGASHRAGAFSSEVLLAIAEVLPNGPINSLETGCGKSTIMFSNISAMHYVFAYDDRDSADSSVSMVQSDPQFKSETTVFVYGPTQRTLPGYQFPSGTLFDVILLDGPHGYPFPDLEYALLYERLKPGGILILDDVHIASIGNMYDLLREDRMYEEVGVFSTTGVLKRTAIDGIPSDGDHWHEQNYNVRRFPLSMEKYKPDRSATLGIKLDLTRKENAEKYILKGLESSSIEAGIQSTDLGAAFELRLPPSDPSQITLDIEYRSIYPDAAADAAIAVGPESRTLPYNAGWNVAKFQFDRPTDGRLVIALLHPKAVTEHDRQNQRYDFRRLGTLIRSIRIVGTESNTLPSTRDSNSNSGLRGIARRLSEFFR